MKLTITDTKNDGAELLSVDIPDVEPSKAFVAIVQALDALPKPRKQRKQRSDAGKKRAEAAS